MKFTDIKGAKLQVLSADDQVLVTVTSEAPSAQVLVSGLGAKYEVRSADGALIASGGVRGSKNGRGRPRKNSLRLPTRAFSEGDVFSLNYLEWK